MKNFAQFQINALTQDLIIYEIQKFKSMKKKLNSLHKLKIYKLEIVFMIYFFLKRNTNSMHNIPNTNNLFYFEFLIKNTELYLNSCLNEKYLHLFKLLIIKFSIERLKSQNFFK